MIPTTVTIAGWTGTEPHPTMEQFRDRLWTRLAVTHPGLRERYLADDRDARREVTDLSMENIQGYVLAGEHTAAAPLANEYATITRAAHDAVTRAGDEYASLSHNTTINWLAAHHRFVTATLRARTLLEQRIEVAADLNTKRGFLAGGEPSTTVYHKHVPAQNRITFPDLDQLKVQLANFIELSTERFAITRATITGGYPTGFEPAPTSETPHRPADDEVAWATGTFHTEPAIIAGHRDW